MSRFSSAAIERARGYLKQFAGAERVYAFMLAEASKTNPPIDYNRQFPAAAQVVTQPHIVPGAFSKGGWVFMKDAIAHADRYFNGEQWGPIRNPPAPAGRRYSTGSQNRVRPASLCCSAAASRSRYVSTSIWVPPPRFSSAATFPA